MHDVSNNEEVVWTPQMPDRRKNRRRASKDLYPNGKTMNVASANQGKERRHRIDRRKNSVTITGRAMDVNH